MTVRRPALASAVLVLTACATTPSPSPTTASTPPGRPALATLAVGTREGQNGAATPWWNGTNLQAEIPDGVEQESKYRSEVFWRYASGKPLRVGEGDRLTCDYSVTPHLGGTASDRDQWQVLWQLHGPDKGGEWPQPPLNLHVRADTWRIGGGAGRPGGTEAYAKPFVPFVDDRQVTWRLDVVVSQDPSLARVDAWLDGRKVVDDWHPPAGTRYPQHAWLGVKTGVYVGSTGGAAVPTNRRYTTQDLLKCAVTSAADATGTPAASP